MNLQQLNQNGRTLKDFIVTAVVALLVTGALWWFIEEANRFRSWQKGDVKPAEYCLTLRILLILWLVKNGHIAWMLKTGAARRILTNSPSGFIAMASTFEEEYYYKRWRAESEGLSAGAYVSIFRRQPHYYYSRPWNIRSGRWN